MDCESISINLFSNVVGWVLLGDLRHGEPMIGPIKVRDYIDLHYDGNVSAFARSQDASPQHVQQWIKGGYQIFDGKLWLISRGIK